VANGKFHPEPRRSEAAHRRGRIPTRPDVETNPPGVLQVLHTKKVIPSTYSLEKDRKADALFKEIIVGVHDIAVRVSAVEKISARNPNE
jgi:hypothetical protein